VEIEILLHLKYKSAGYLNNEEWWGYRN